jgi:transketolase
MNQSELDNLCINTIRMLSADAVEKANSGHPGLPMGAAAFSYALWMHTLKFNPSNPNWINRDRFVLSAGHGSMLLYSLLHLTGYDLSLDELKNFRQWGSKTPGHPEFGHTPGVETTTGPLGQGFANAVGMALAEKIYADHYNRPNYEIIDYHTYVLASDGDLMEGISAEAASYAGSLKLGKLICLYDSNQISIEGSTSLTFNDDTILRFKSYGWHTITLSDGNDLDAVDAALSEAKNDDRPTFILLKTHIGFGSPNKQDKASAHGSALGAEEIKLTKKALGWPLEPIFFVPDDVNKYMHTCVQKGSDQEEIWRRDLVSYKKDFPELAKELENDGKNLLAFGWEEALPKFTKDSPAMATREASGVVMNSIASKFSFFLGGSGDLAPSNNTHLKEYSDIEPGPWQPGSRNIHFGIREHAMGGILNGLAVSKQIIPYGATFLCFSDYMRASIRLASIMKLGVIYVFTHDSIAQGEDGTTHQPIEHLASLRAMPGITVFRPADATETVVAWKCAIEKRDGPSALILTRQKLPVLDREILASAENLQYGAYILKDTIETPDILLIATGSEISIALEASEQLTKDGVNNRVISMPSTEVFDQQSEEYKSKILPKSTQNRLVIEAASSYGWEKYIGDHGDTITIDEFGSSAPGPIIMERYGFTAANIVDRAKSLIKKNDQE